MPLINQPTLNADLSGLTNAPYFDWANAISLSKQLTVENNKLEGLHRGFGIGDKGCWESNTPLLSQIDIIVSSSDPTPTGDYYMGVGVTKWNQDDYSFARIAYNVTLAPYVS